MTWSECLAGGRLLFDRRGAASKDSSLDAVLVSNAQAAARLRDLSLVVRLLP